MRAFERSTVRASDHGMKTASRAVGTRVTSALTLATLLVSLGAAPVRAQSTPPPVAAPPAAPADVVPAPPEPGTPASVESAPPVEVAPAPEVVVPPAPEVVVPAPLEPLEAPPTEAAPPPSLAAPYALWGLGGASLIAGTVLGILALKAESDYEDGPTRDRADKVHNLGIAADVGLGLGVVLAVTGTIFYLRGGDAPESGAQAQRPASSRAHLHVAPSVGARAGGAALSLRF